MIETNENTAKQVIRDLVEELFPQSSILLFGSRARNEQSEQSDYDLMIITKEIHEKRELRLKKGVLRKKLAQHHIPADIIIQTEDEVTRNMKLKGHIVHEILKEAISL